jgi:hypothetical protein
MKGRKYHNRGIAEKIPVPSQTATYVIGEVEENQAGANKHSIVACDSVVHVRDRENSA